MNWRRFLLDEMVNLAVVRVLRQRGVDVVHAVERGLISMPDLEVLAWATREKRILITRNYRDFAPLVRLYAHRGAAFPGALFLPAPVKQADVGSHVRALLGWLESAGDENPIANTYGWL